ncbi:MAG: xanthine dehydrogenase family protein molybdopterin-binding subunit [Actinomycetota bacterium]|nr:xanthine dehydrogenase family protein molybdopterin-binding subunit [Actinomycetota bacterium]
MNQLAGTSFPMRDARDRVIGSLPLVLNEAIPGMAFAAAVRSPVPHALIRSIDAQPAREMPGVVAVLTGEDLAAQGDIDPLYGGQRDDQPIVAIGKVRYAGEIVALVIADSPEIAAEAVTWVDVEYDELPFVVDPVEAMSEGAPVIHDEWPDNDCGTWKLRHGDIEAGWAMSDRINEDTYTSPPASHVPMEPHVALATFDEDAGLEVLTASQAPYMVHTALTRMFDLPPEKVRIRTLNLGGAYGAKGGVKLEPLVAYAAWVTRRPVKMTLTRPEVFLTTGKHSAHVAIKTGVTNDGTIVARQVWVTYNAGAYAASSPTGAGQGMTRAPGPYRIPHVWVDATSRYTNSVPTGPFRGAMTSQVCWAYESQLDDIAADLGIDPVELRRRNLLREGDVYATGESLHDVHFTELLDDVVDAIGWNEEPAPDGDTLVRGKGLALMIKSTLTPSRSEARLRLTADGKLTILSSSVEMGQGAAATLLQIAADATRIPAESIEAPFPDTSITPFDTVTASSRTTFSMGAAVRDAAINLRAQLDDLLVDQLEVDRADLHHEGGAAGVKGAVSMTGYGEVLRRAHVEELIGEGVFESTEGMATLDRETGQGRASVHWHEGAVGAEVEVDLETGRIRVLRCHGTSFAGRVINPLRVKQQNEGNMIFGLGPALFEELVYDSGQVVNPNLSDYMIPSILDIPERLTSSAVENDDEDADVHGVGEMTIPPLAPAIANAIFRATGARIRELPITPERVLRALDDRAKPSSDRLDDRAKPS